LQPVSKCGTHILCVDIQLVHKPCFYLKIYYIIKTGRNLQYFDNFPSTEEVCGQNVAVGTHSFPFPSPSVHHCVPSGFSWTLTAGI